MGNDVANPLPAFGFLTVLEDAQHGFFGGYLLLSQLGRPLEFHCSTPVQPNEAQRILYGASLRPYVLGELIGQTLVEKSQLAAQAIITDKQEILTLSLLRDEPIVCLKSAKSEPENDAQSESINIESDAPEFAIGSYRLHGTSTCGWQPLQVQNQIVPLTKYLDLSEPFQRIHEAIREAQRITEQPSDNENESSAAA